MKVAILQPGYLPWLGFFEQMQRVERFIYLDDVQYTKQDWRNRNRIKTPDGPVWLTVPVRKAPTGTPINEILIDHRQGWVDKHLRLLHHAYAKSTYFEFVMQDLRESLTRGHDRLQDLCIEVTALMCRMMNIETPTQLASTLRISEDDKTRRLVAICQAVGADSLYDGKAAADFIEHFRFDEAGVELEFQDYRHPVYPQLWGEFLPYMSAIDVLFNCGPHARDVMCGRADVSEFVSDGESLCAR